MRYGYNCRIPQTNPAIPARYASWTPIAKESARDLSPPPKYPRSFLSGCADKVAPGLGKPMVLQKMCEAIAGHTEPASEVVNWPTGDADV